MSLNEIIEVYEFEGDTSFCSLQDKLRENPKIVNFYLEMNQDLIPLRCYLTELKHSFPQTNFFLYGTENQKKQIELVLSNSSDEVHKFYDKFTVN